MRSLLLVLRGPAAPPWCATAGTHHHIAAVHSVAEAEGHLAASHVDAILLEATSRGMDAAEDTERLARLAPVVVVGPPDPDVVRAALLAGADEYLGETLAGAAALSLAVECALARRDVRRKELAVRDRHHAQEMQHEQSRLRIALINHLADRLLNPTTVIRLQASILAKEVEGVDAARLAQMQAAAERLRATVEQIAYAFEAQTGSPNVLSSPQHLASLHDKALAAAGVGPCSLEGDAVVEVDPVHVEEVLSTALRWAADQGPGRLSAMIEVIGARARYRLRVPAAIDDDHQAIFNPFYGLEDPQAGGGMGLGLYAARLNARRMGGDLRIAPGEPTYLEFDIALQPAPGPATRLIIDATPRRGRWIGRSESPDERLLAASSWHAARRLLGASTPGRIIIGDPADVDGGDLAHLLRERFPDAVIERLGDDRTPRSTRLASPLDAPNLAGGGAQSLGGPERAVPEPARRSHALPETSY